MNLIKKTVILTSGAAEGYVSVIRVGNDVGAKIVGADFVKGMRAGIKIGRSDTIYAVLDGTKTEIDIDNVTFHQNDGIGCVIMQGDRIVARGGISVKAKDVSEYFAALDQSKSEQIAAISLNAEEQTYTESGDKVDTDVTVGSDSVKADNTDGSLISDAVDSEEGNFKEDNTGGSGINNSIERTNESSDGAETEPANNRHSSVQPNLSNNDGETVTKKKGAENNAKGSDAAEILEKLSAKDGAEFYNGVREKVEELFIVFPKEKLLPELIPDSEWVKINYDGEDYYIVGRIFENGRTVLLGYGVPGKKSVTPPKIADEIATWLTVPELGNGYDGYWLIFQDASNGKVVPAN